MRLLIVLTGLVFSISLSTAGFAASDDSATGEINEKCTYPRAPSIPNGKTSTEEQLLETQRNMKAYMAEGDEFIACLHRVEDTWSEEEKIEKQSFVVMFHNRMVDDMNEVADLFNTSVRAFKGRK